MTIAKYVILLMGVVLALVGVADIWLAVKFSEEVTITAVVRKLAQEYPALPFAVGFLMGHLFWR